MDILKRLICLMWLTIAMTACYTDFEPDLKSSPVLCMNAVIEAGHDIEIKLTRTWRYSDGRPDDITVTDAVISLWINGVMTEEIRYDSKLGYRSKFTVNQGDEVRLLAQSEQYGPAEATVKVPVAVPVDTVKCIADFEIAWSSVTTDYIAITLGVKLNMEMPVTDPAGASHFYQVRWDTATPMLHLNPDKWQYPSDVKFRLSGFDYDAEPLFAEHIGALDAISGSDAYGFTVFSDRQFSGRTYPLHLRFTSGSIDIFCSPDNWSDSLLDCKVILTLNSMSDSMYNWYLHVWQTDESILGSLADIGMADTMCGYSNVSTHAGIVCAYSSAEYEVNLAPVLKNFFKNLNNDETE